MTPEEITCPRCESAPGERCIDMRSKHCGRFIPNNVPHPERIAAAKGLTHD